MENEKLKNQKIGENEMEDVAGGRGIYGASIHPSEDGNGLLLCAIEVSEDTYEKLKAVGYIKCLENPKEEYISKTQLKKVLRLIHKKNKTSDSTCDKTCKLKIR